MWKKVLMEELSPGNRIYVKHSKGASRGNVIIAKTLLKIEGKAFGVEVFDRDQIVYIEREAVGE